MWWPGTQKSTWSPIMQHHGFFIDTFCMWQSALRFHGGHGSLNGLRYAYKSQMVHNGIDEPQKLNVGSKCVVMQMPGVVLATACTWMSALRLYLIVQGAICLYSTPPSNIAHLRLWKRKVMTWDAKKYLKSIYVNVRYCIRFIMYVAYGFTPSFEHNEPKSVHSIITSRTSAALSNTKSLM